MNSDHNNVDELARVLWDFHCEVGEPKRADFILALGSHDTRVADHAAELFLKDFAPWLVTAGGLGKVTSAEWGVPEGVRFAEIAKAKGVPADRIVVEDRSTNTGDNIVFSRQVIEKHEGICTAAGLIVTKPYMKRRALATASKQWPEVRWYAHSPPSSYETYPDADFPKERMINLMVGDLQRLRVYAEKGFQVPVDIPVPVWEAYEKLVALGFDKFVIK